MSKFQKQVQSWHLSCFEGFQLVQESFNALPRGNVRRSLPTEGSWPRPNRDGGQGPKPWQNGGAAVLSKSLLGVGTHSSNKQSSKGFSDNKKGNLPLGSLQASLSSGSLSITRTSPPINPATREGHEPITLTVRKQWSILFTTNTIYLLICYEGDKSRPGWHYGTVGLEQGIKF